MHVRIIPLVLVLLLVGACRDASKGPRVTVTEVDSTGRLPDRVNTEIYTAGRLILQQQKEAADRLRELAKRFSAMGDTASTNQR